MEKEKRVILKGKSKSECSEAYLWTVNDESSPLHGLDIWLLKSQVTLTPEGDALDCPAWLKAAEEDARRNAVYEKVKRRCLYRCLARLNYSRDEEA